MLIKYSIVTENVLTTNNIKHILDQYELQINVNYKSLNVERFNTTAGKVKRMNIS